MKKTIIYFIIITMFIGVFFVQESNAAEQINTGNALIDALNSVDNNNEKEVVLKLATKEAMIEADQIIQDEFLNFMSTKEFYLDSDESYKVENFLTKSNVNIKVVLSDYKEDEEGNVLPETRAFTGYKEYGDRRYTIECYAQHPKGQMTLKVINRYTINENGLVVRKPPHKYPTYLETSNTYYIKKKKTELTYPITSASKVNQYIQINGAVYYRTTTDVGIESKKLWGLHAQTKIKLLELDKKNKRAKVDERSFIGRSEQWENTT